MGHAKSGDGGACRLVHRIDPGDGQRAGGGFQDGKGSDKAGRRRQAGGGGRDESQRRFGLQPLGHRNRHVDMHRAGLARSGCGDGLGHHRAHRTGGGAKAGFDNRPQHRLMIKHLMGKGFGIGTVHAAGQKYQRNPVLHGIRHHVHRIGHTGAKGCQQHRQRPRAVPQALGKEAARVFVFDKGKAHAGILQPMHHRQNLAPRNAESMGRPRRRKGAADDFCPGQGGGQVPGWSASHIVPPMVPLALRAARASPLRPRMSRRTAPLCWPRVGGAFW